MAVSPAQELQQLRDIHVPEAPGWWPPAPGWWLLAVAVLVLAGWLIWRARRAQRRRRPLVRARALYEELHRRFQRGELTTRQYLDQSNELIKRALIHGLGEVEARRASGRQWLELLDRHLGEPAFTQGPGRLLGNERFRPHLADDVDAESLHPLVKRLLGALTPDAGARA